MRKYENQLGSFESQKLYYEEKIRANQEWENTGVFADEAIIGTKVVSICKRVYIRKIYIFNSSLK